MLNYITHNIACAIYLLIIMMITKAREAFAVAQVLTQSMLEEDTQHIIFCEKQKLSKQRQATHKQARKPDKEERERERETCLR